MSVIVRDKYILVDHRTHKHVPECGDEHSPCEWVEAWALCPEHMIYFASNDPDERDDWLKECKQGC